MPKHIVKSHLARFMTSAAFIIGLSLFGFNTNDAAAQNASLPPLEEMVADRVLGNKDAKVTVVEYASMTCPHCAAFHAGPYPTIKKEYIDTGKIKFIFRHFPLNQVDWAASMLSRCAPRERFFPIIDIIFRTQQTWGRVADPRAALAQIGLLAGISKPTFDACLSSNALFEGLGKISQEADKKYKVRSTPSFVINEKLIDGHLPIEKFREILDAELAKAN